MSKNGYLLPVLSVFFVLYFFLFPYPVREEYVLVPERKISLENVTGDLAGLSGSIRSFRGENRMGYYDGEGHAVILDGTGRSCISDRFFLQEREGELVAHSRSGQDTFVLDTALTPLLFGDHLFLTDIFQGYISETDIQGRTLWDYDLPSLITCMDYRDGLTAVGLLNGEIRLFDERGEALFTWSPGGSRISAIYGIALSPGGESIALVSGLDPQRFILLERKENGYRPVFHENLADSSRQPLTLSFDDSRNILIRGKGEGLFYRPNTPSLMSFPLEGEFVEGVTSPDDGTILFASEENQRALLALYTRRGDLILTNRYGDRIFDMDMRDGKILLAGSDRAYILGRGFY